MKARTLRAAAVQMHCRDGDIEGNLERALSHVEAAAREGAELALLPELLAAGYVFTPAIWEAGEPAEGPTVRWLRRHSKRLGLYLGACFLEAEAVDFYNTFVLAAPDGSEAGRVRKQVPAAFEAYFFRGDPGPHTIKTGFGTVGVGICYENQLSFLPRLLLRGQVDLVLQPHSAPTPAVGILFPPGAVKKDDEDLAGLAARYAAMLGVPAVMCNKCGPWESPSPGIPFLREVSSFPGHSAVVDSDGTVKDQMGNEEGFALGDVLLDPARKKKELPVFAGRWAWRQPRAKNLFRVAESMGKLSYRFSMRRVRAARKISGGP